MSEKWDVRDIATANFNTYKDARTGKRKASDFAAFLLAPLLMGLVATSFQHFGNFAIYDVSRLVAGVGIFTGLLFGLLANVFTLSLRLQRDEDLSDHATTVNVKELFANLSWAVLVGLALVFLMIFCASTTNPKKPIPPFWTLTLVPLFSHLILTVLMCLKRLWMAHQKIALLPPKEKTGS